MTPLLRLKQVAFVLTSIIVENYSRRMELFCLLQLHFAASLTKNIKMLRLGLTEGYHRSAKGASTALWKDVSSLDA
jgi:hypothetical protein